ncbi:MAG: hypothetical protein ACYCPS_00650 [Candidatus Saccharimonadales bacterium]
MNKPVNSSTLSQINDYLKKPGQSVSLVGAKWLNKSQLANYLAASLLEINIDQLNSYPYLLRIAELSSPIIGIDEIRQTIEFLILKVPNKKLINRVVIIERADRLTLEAQNALLKNLEEPPSGTVFILTYESVSSLLPTITSRLHSIKVYKPSSKELTAYYKQQGYSQSEITQALLISDRLPGVMDQVLTGGDSDISDALPIARKLLSSTTFERLSLVNSLSKDKPILINVLFVIKQMAKIGIRSKDPKNANKWRKILLATIDSERKLGYNVQTKLLLTDYILNLG